MNTTEGMMKSHTDYLWFTTKKRHEFINITDDVAGIVAKSGVKDGIALVSAMHITAAVYINDAESGLIHDIESWLKEIAPIDRDYRHHQTGEDNGYAHLWNLTIGHQQIVPITDGSLDLGPWEQVYYAEFDGQRKKRVIVKVMGI
jgi:secondary thiamine-phosphate synthase enzyme